MPRHSLEGSFHLSHAPFAPYDITELHLLLLPPVHPFRPGRRWMTLEICALETQLEKYLNLPLLPVTFFLFIQRTTFKLFNQLSINSNQTTPNKPTNFKMETVKVCSSSSTFSPRDAVAVRSACYPIYSSFNPSTTTLANILSPERRKLRR